MTNKYGITFFLQFSSVEATVERDDECDRECQSVDTVVRHTVSGSIGIHPPWLKCTKVILAEMSYWPYLIQLSGHLINRYI